MQKKEVLNCKVTNEEHDRKLNHIAQMDSFPKFFCRYIIENNKYCYYAYLESCSEDSPHLYLCNEREQCGQIPCHETTAQVVMTTATITYR